MRTCLTSGKRCTDTMMRGELVDAEYRSSEHFSYSSIIAIGNQWRCAFVYLVQASCVHIVKLDCSI